MEKEVKCDGSLSIKDGGMDAVRAIIESYGVKKYDEIYFCSTELDFSHKDFPLETAYTFLDEAKDFLTNYSFDFEADKGTYCYRLTKRDGFEVQNRIYHLDVIRNLAKAGYS